MLKVREAIGITAALSVSACSGVGLGDQFDYITKSDEFTGAKITEASATVSGDVDKNASLTVVLRCKYPASEQPDPFKHTTIEFSLVDPKGDPKDFSDLTVKFDDAPPPGAKFLEERDISKYSNVSEQYYSSMAVVMLPPKERVPALYARDQATAYKLINRAIHARSIMVRYETAGGMVNTNTLSIDGANYRKVLEDCGWQKWVKNYEETRAQATAAPAPAPSAPASVASASAPQSNGIPANRLANGRWICTDDSRFPLEIINHRVDTAAIDPKAANGFAERAEYRLVGSRQGRTSGTVRVSMGCPMGNPDCASFEQVPKWYFDFAPNSPYEEAPDPSTKKMYWISPQDSGGEAPMCEKQ